MERGRDKCRQEKEKIVVFSFIKSLKWLKLFFFNLKT